MNNRHKIFLTTFLFLLTFRSHHHVQAASSISCQYVERYENCPDQEETVCSVYPGICVSASCQPSEYYNSCYACSDPTVMAYHLGPCTANEQPQGSSDASDGPDGGDPPFIIDPLDGIYMNGGGMEALIGGEDEYAFIGEEDINNEYELSSMYQQGSSQNAGAGPNIIPLRTSFYVVVYCDVERPTSCTNVVDPVCVISCLNSQCQNTVNNVCLACANTNALSYSLGACEEQMVSCPVIDFSTDTTTCTTFYDPVCAYPQGCSTKSCAKTITNSCVACYSNKASSFTLGPC